MKAFILAALFITTNALAFDFCAYDDVVYLYQDMHKANIEAYKESNHRSGFSNAEKELIRQTVLLDIWQDNFTIEEALEVFLDMWETRVGDLAGAIDYFNIDGEEIVHVFYYPGDNEYGAFWKNENGKFTLLVEIEDSSVICAE